MRNDTLAFLTELADNNNKEWMDANRNWYQEVRKGFLDTVKEFLLALSQIDPAFSAVDPKKCVFRQNRDIRFSANKDPYKNNMGAFFSPQGKNTSGPGYYIHLQPGECFLAGGVWMPPADKLKKIRQEIDYAGGELEKIIHEASFKAAFGELKGEQLKSSPRGYPNDHPYIDLMRMKSFVVTRPLSDQEVLSGNLVEHCMKYYTLMGDFNVFLARALEEVEGGEGIL